MKVAESTNAAAILRGIGQAMLLLAFFGAIALLAGWPPYRQLEEGQAELKLSLRHSGARVGECRERNAAELAALPENMRAVMECPRERSPIRLQLDVNGARLVDETLLPSGLHSDGRAVFYRRIQVPAGPLRLDVRMNDDSRHEGFQHSASFDQPIAPEQALVIDFDPASSAFQFLEGP